MSPTDLTAIMSAIIATCGTIAIPLWFRHKRARDDESQFELVNWKNMNAALAKERDDLRLRLDVIDSHYIERIKQLDADWQGQMVNARTRIRQLEEEVSQLQAALRSLGGSR